MSKSKKPNIYVTSPQIPNRDAFMSLFDEIASSRILTNGGIMSKRLESELAAFLDVAGLSLFSNGSLSLVVAIRTLGLKGEIITTPYTFMATVASIVEAGCVPVFVDTCSEGCNISPKAIAAAVTDKTVGIMPVHCYGLPCDMDAIEEVARRHNLKVIYDAAHAFGVRKNGKSILGRGDFSSLSFHATKVFNTFEGGALVTSDVEMQIKAEQLRNFGFVGETEVREIALNAKMDELRAAVGLVNLRSARLDIASRLMIANRYRINLSGVQGIELLNIPDDVEWNASHFPIFVNEIEYGMSRDMLYEKMKASGIFGRRYFYPLICDFAPYKRAIKTELIKVSGNLVNARRLSNSVICLPIYPHLEFKTVDMICDIICRKQYL